MNKASKIIAGEGQYFDFGGLGVKLKIEGAHNE